MWCVQIVDCVSATCTNKCSYPNCLMLICHGKRNVPCIRHGHSNHTRYVHCVISNRPFDKTFLRHTAQHPSSIITVERNSHGVKFKGKSKYYEKKTHYSFVVSSWKKKENHSTTTLNKNKIGIERAHTERKRERKKQKNANLLKVQTSCIRYLVEVHVWKIWRCFGVCVCVINFSFGNST